MPLRPGNPKHQMLSPEETFAEFIKAGKVKIVRRRGKPPLVIWLTDTRK